jgi:predicted RNase H-like nuclease (RuvC/YqgF family)
MTARVVIGVLLTALVGGSAAWITLAKETPNEKRVREIAAAEITKHELKDPYKEDAKLLEFRLEQNTEKLEKVVEEMQDLKRDVGEIMGVLKSLSRQLDDVSRQLPPKDDDG